jgi:hypothetical protein
MATSMEHFIWQGYFPGSGYAFAEEQQGLNTDQTVDTLLGRKLTKAPKRVVITALSEGELPDLLESGWSAKLVSQKLKKVLERSCPDCIQYIPAKLEEYPDEKYWIANVLTSVEVVDREKSKITTSPRAPHAIRKVNKLVLKPIADDAPALFRMGELPPEFMVSDSLRKELEAASSTAGRFIKVKDYRRPPKS